MDRGAIQLGIETIIIIAIAIIVLIFVMFFFYDQFIGPAWQLGNYSSGLNITIPNI